jgi:hypothetical protein
LILLALEVARLAFWTHWKNPGWSKEGSGGENHTTKCLQMSFAIKFNKKPGG